MKGIRILLAICHAFHLLTHRKAILKISSLEQSKSNILIKLLLVLKLVEQLVFLALLLRYLLAFPKPLQDSFLLKLLNLLRGESAVLMRLQDFLLGHFLASRPVNKEIKISHILAILDLLSPGLGVFGSLRILRDARVLRVLAIVLS